MNDVSDAEMQAIATLAAALLQQQTKLSREITQEDIKQTLLLAARALKDAIRHPS